MEYVFTRIEEAASRVRGEALEVQKALEKKDWEYFGALDDRYKKTLISDYGDKPEFKDIKRYAQGVSKRLWDAYEALRRAAIYAQRVERLTSCDDGFGSFIGRVDEELELLKQEKNSGKWDQEEEVCNDR